MQQDRKVDMDVALDSLINGDAAEDHLMMVRQQQQVQNKNNQIVYAPSQQLNQNNQQAAAIEFAFCAKLKQCGHSCKGIQGVAECLPCLAPAC